MERYAIRAFKYAVYLVLLFFVIFFVMNIIQGSKLPFWGLVSGARGLMFLVVVVVFSAIYPFFGFVKRTLTFDASQKVEEVTNVMATCGFVRVDGSPVDDMRFRARTSSKKMAMMWEDEIVILTVDGLSTIRGSRREVVKASFRFGTFIG